MMECGTVGAHIMRYNGGSTSGRVWWVDQWKLGNGGYTQGMLSTRSGGYGAK